VELGVALKDSQGCPSPV